MRSSISQIVAGCGGMGAFAVSIIVGLASGNDGLTILGRAVVAMFLCWIVGYICGMLIEWALRQQIQHEAAQESSAQASSDRSEASAPPRSSTGERSGEELAA